MQGYSGTIGDGGKAILSDNSTAGNTKFSMAQVDAVYADLIFTTTTATGTDNLVSANGASFFRCVAHGARGSAFVTNNHGIVYLECEAYDFNKSNTSNLAGIDLAGGGATIANCTIRDSSGSNCNGIRIGVGLAPFSVYNCIIHNLGGSGILIGVVTNVRDAVIMNNNFYNNTGDAINITSTTSAVHILNNNFVKNTGKGINNTTLANGVVFNNGYGSGTQANAADVTGQMMVSGAVTYASGVTPWNSPTTGDFRISLAAANFAGRGAFTQTDATFGSATVGYPDIGAVQSLTGPGGTFTKEVSAGYAH
jgi:hypothetical protein